jgi:phosphopantetheine adenylyltransferase/dephospho-CoA kinase
VIKAARIFPRVIAVCSSNPGKNTRMFSETESKAMWATYELPDNVSAATFKEISDFRLQPSSLVMVRGMRGQMDIECENEVMIHNHTEFGIDKYFYVFSDSNIYCSSSLARELASGLKIEKLWNYVSPQVISMLLEKVLNLKNIFMVVGRPGAGKSTFLKELSRINPKNHIIDGDELTRRAKKTAGVDYSIEYFKGLAMNNDPRLLELIGSSFIRELKSSLRSAPKDSNVFIEIPYGMCKDRKMFRYVGGKVIYLGCSESSNLERVRGRGTPEHSDFVSRIPGLEETQRLAEKFKLSLRCIETDYTLNELRNIARRFNDGLLKGRI